MYSDKKHGAIERIQCHNTGSLLFEPGSREKYSSTNFILLGLVLAQQANGATSSWAQYDQKAFLRSAQYNVNYATHGTPKDVTVVHGYDRTSYNHQKATLEGEHSDQRLESSRGVFAAGLLLITWVMSEALQHSFMIYTGHQNRLLTST